MQTVAPRRVLPQFVQIYAVATAAGPSPAAPERDRLNAAAAKRDAEFTAGRHCAAQALRLLGVAEWDTPVGVGEAGEPIWPAGYTGSITHTQGFVTSAVARLQDAISVGIDAEAIVDPARAARISRAVLHACETRLRAAGLDAATVFTLIFSAKESLFKCLYPLVQRRFDYRDAAVRRFDVAEGRIEMELLTSLAPGYHRGRRFSGQFDVDGQLVSTGFCIENGNHGK
jgi:enterobactin synthetase component D